MNLKHKVSAALFLAITVTGIGIAKSWHLWDPHYRAVLYTFEKLKPKELEEATFINTEMEAVRFSEIHKPNNIYYFWASWCRPCLETLAKIDSQTDSEFYQSIILISLETDIDATVLALSEFNLSNTLLFGNGDLLDKGYFGNKRRALPYSIILDDAARADKRALGSVEIDSLWRQYL